MIITLLDGRTEDTGNVFFDPATYVFKDIASGEDLSNLIRFADKSNFPGWDAAKQLAFTSNNSQGIANTPENTLTPGETPGTLSNFWTQLTTDPLAAPLDSLNKGIDKLVQAPAILKVGVAAVVVIGIVLILRSKKA